MGNVRTEHIKRLAEELIRRFPNKFSSKFEENKHAVSTLLQGATTKVRNQIAGYITHIYGGMQTPTASEGSESG
ncbi:MAG: 30S ribosomal protein S17e [Candidatus Bathyarchaeia archaeon]